MVGRNFDGGPRDGSQQGGQPDRPARCLHPLGQHRLGVQLFKRFRLFFFFLLIRVRVHDGEIPQQVFENGQRLLGVRLGGARWHVRGQHNRIHQVHAGLAIEAGH